MMPPAMVSDTSDSCSHARKVRPPGQEREEDDVGEQALVQDDAHAPLRRYFRQCRNHERQVAERIEHQDQQDRRGEQVEAHGS